MNKILTAEDFLKENANDISYEEGQMFAADVTPDMLIQFTKLHVQAALEAAYQKATFTTDSGITITFSEGFGDLDKDSILNAYPENLIQ